MHGLWGCLTVESPLTANSLRLLDSLYRWHPFDESIVCCPCLTLWYAVRALARDSCCAVGASAAAEARLKAASVAGRQKAAEREAARGCCARCVRLPIGRTAHYFDIDIVADVRAEQACWQLPLNEGSIHFGRLQGGDASHDATAHGLF